MGWLGDELAGAERTQSPAAHAESDVHRLVADQPFDPDLEPQGIEENQGIDCFQRAGVPGCDLLQHRVGDCADQIRRDLDTVEIAERADDLARAHTAGVHRDDLVVEPREAALILGDQLRIKLGLAVVAEPPARSGRYR